MPEENLIPIIEIEGSFKNFLTKENSRIFFSGRYGIGKTYFLNEFFEAHSDEYEAFHLYPVNYQISSNEDIIDLLKYDVLIKFLDKNSEAFDENNVAGVSGWTSLFASFLKEKGSWNVFLQSTVEAGSGLLNLSPDPIMKAVGKLGKSVQELLKFDKEFQKFKKEYEAGDKGKVEEFLREMETKTISDTDYLSYILREKISEQKGGKRSVLILDDMDRIDPEHIFRILNIFSAHFSDEDNKFGFDHVIIVGDVNNIKSIFHHKYGDNAEFGGYFDKFFTTKLYEFTNAKAVKESIPRILKRIKYEESSLSGAVGEGGIIKHFLEEVLVRAFEIKEMNLRQLYKAINHSFPEMGKGVFHKDSFSDQRNQLIDISIKLLVALYVNNDNFLVVLEKIRNGASPSDFNDEWLYKEYTNSMLRRLVALKPGTKMSWLKEYPIVAIQSESNSSQIDIYLEENMKPSARFFYDVLYEYIRNGKYEKKSIYDYER